MTRRGTNSRPSILAMVSWRRVRFEVADGDVDAVGAERLRLVEHAREGPFMQLGTALRMMELNERR